MTFRVPEQYRVARVRRSDGANLSSDASFGNNGCFRLPAVVPGRSLWTIASDGLDWEHVSVSIEHQPTRTPTWAEMHAVKRAFWSDEDVVMQLHPSESQWVNVHAGCLHLWRPNDGREIPTPPRRTHNRDGV